MLIRLLWENDSLQSPLCGQVFKTYSGGVCDEAIALGHEERFGKVLDVYEKCLANREVSTLSAKNPIKFNESNFRN